MTILSGHEFPDMKHFVLRIQSNCFTMKTTVYQVRCRSESQWSNR